MTIKMCFLIQHLICMQLLLVMAALGIEYVVKINIHIRNSSDTAVFVVSLLLHIIFILSSSITQFKRIPKLLRLKNIVLVPRKLGQFKPKLKFNLNDRLGARMTSYLQLSSAVWKLIWNIFRKPVWTHQGKQKMTYQNSSLTATTAQTMCAENFWERWEIILQFWLLTGEKHVVGLKFVSFSNFANPNSVTPTF